MHSLTYGGLKYQARALGPQKAYTAASRFLLATQSLVEPNQVHLIEHMEEDEELVCVNVFPHPHPVTTLAASPVDESLLLTAYASVSGSTLTEHVGVWRLGGDDMNATLDSVAQVPCGAHALLWEETMVDAFFTADATHVRCWDANTSAARVSFALGDAAVAGTSAVGALASNTHFPSVVAVCVADAVVALDVRDASQIAWKITGADRDQIRDLDFNPNRPYYLCAGGDDGVVKFWDYRKAGDGPVGRLNPPHSHWVTAVSFNPHHDSLVLSSGTDGAVNLYSANSVSSAPVVAGTSGASGPAGDYLISSYDSYSRSVYACCWSSFDTWIYAHLCYDGKAVVSAVSEKEKMKILNC